MTKPTPTHDYVVGLLSGEEITVPVIKRDQSEVDIARDLATRLRAQEVFYGPCIDARGFDAVVVPVRQIMYIGIAPHALGAEPTPPAEPAEREPVAPMPDDQPLPVQVPEPAAEPAPEPEPAAEPESVAVPA